MDSFAFKVLPFPICLVGNLQQYEVPFLRVSHGTPSPTKVTTPKSVHHQLNVEIAQWCILSGGSQCMLPPGDSERIEGGKRTFLMLSNPALPALKVYLLISMNCTWGNIDQVFHSYLTLKYLLCRDQRQCS